MALLLAGGTGCGPSEAVRVPAAAPEVSQLQSSLTQVTNFGSNPGNLGMFRHVPAGMPANAPLVVVLHGCLMQAADMEGSGWTAAADLYKFYVVYPDQKPENNSSECFNWFVPGDYTRGQGEAASIKQMVDAMKAEYSIDSSRVYVAGFSAGGYMASVLLAAYPDVFSAASINAGGPYRCSPSASIPDAFSCMGGSVTRTPQEWGDYVRSAWSSAGYTGPSPRVSIWQGTGDYTVRPVNMTEAMEQWTNVHGIDQTADTTETVAGFPRRIYRDSAGTALVETWEITNMGHSVGIDPQFNFPDSTKACGAIGAYRSDVNLCAVYHQAQFFELIDGGELPEVTLTEPVNGATVRGTVTVRASASDPVGIERVEFLVGNTPVFTDSVAPYEFAWDSTGVSDGQHTLGARAYNTAGKQATDNATTVTVDNIAGPEPVTAHFTSIAADDGYLKANADGSAPALGTLTGLALGRGTDGKYNRSFLSFDTSSIPDNAVIHRAYLTVSYSSGSGDPWATPSGNSLLIDVKNGTFNAATTETADWAATATASDVADIAKFTTGTKASADFSGAGLSAINLAGKTQLRLRFTGNQTATAYLFIRDGANATLTVEYTAP